MLGRIAREEAGMTMALAIIMIVLIAVMGAGLLTFAMRDLNAVVEVNQGQNASEAADLGIQAAKRQLLANSFPNLYNDPAYPPTPPFDSDPANVQWAAYSPSAVCGSLPSGPGKCITSTSNGDTRVTIRYLPPPNGSSSGPGSRADPNYAPVNLPTGQTDYANQEDYFRIDSEAMYGKARRKIQAIYATGSLGLPVTYRVSGDININGGTTINNLSIFSGGNITGIQVGSQNTLTGRDLSYGNWSNSYNNKARLSSTGTPLANVTAPTGAGAEGTIEYGGSRGNVQRVLPAEASDRYEKLDFDRECFAGNTTCLPPNPPYKFCRQGSSCWPTGTPQPSNVITYPFKYNSKFDAELMQSVASTQGNYVEMAGGGGTSTDITIDASKFNQITPPLSSVFMVRFTGDRGLARVVSSGSPDDCGLKGTILVINGGVVTANSGGKCFDGVISIQDPNNLGDLEYRNIGNFTLNGFTNIEGTATIAGTVDPHILDDIVNHPGFHELKLWSWRECYDTQASTGCAP